MNKPNILGLESVSYITSMNNILKLEDPCIKITSWHRIALSVTDPVRRFLSQRAFDVLFHVPLNNSGSFGFLLLMLSLLRTAVIDPDNI